MFDQWVDGHPWWMTLLLMPVVVLAAVVGRAVRYGALALIAVAVLGAAAWMWARRRR